MTESGEFLLADGKRVLEVLVYKHLPSGRLLLPGNVIENDERLPVGLVHELGVATSKLAVRKIRIIILRYLSQASEAEKVELHEQLKEIFAQGVVIFEVRHSFSRFQLPFLLL